MFILWEKHGKKGASNLPTRKRLSSHGLQRGGDNGWRLSKKRKASFCGGKREKRKGRSRL